MEAIKISGNLIKTKTGSTIGKIDGKIIRDHSSKILCKIDGIYIRNSSGVKIGALSGDKLRDSSGKVLCGMDEVRKSISGGLGGVTLAAIWLCFVR